MSESPDSDLTDTEREALHDLQLGVEYIYRGYGNLLEFHHTIGHGMDYFDDAESKLREAGRTDMADRLRDEQLPTGMLNENWTYELVEAFEHDLLADVTAFEDEIREDLADGQKHVSERRQQQAWRERGEDQTE